MKIRKFVALVICPVVLTLFLSPVSFAKDSISPVTSPMSEPVPSIVFGTEYDTVTLYYVVQWNASYVVSGTRYELYEMICRIPHGSTAVFNIKRQQTALFFSGSRLPPFTLNVYDVLTGSLISSDTNANFQSYGSVDGFSSSYGFRAGYFPEIVASSDVCAGGFVIVPDGISITGGDSVYNSAPFVTWSVLPLEHNIYHSQLSEPVADKYNRYFVLDDKLFWVSIRVNGFWVKSADIEGSTGYYQYEALAPQNGGYEYGYQGVLAQYSGYVPVNLNYSGFFNGLPFDLVLLPSTDQWSIGVKSSSIFSDVQSKIDCEFFISEFNLVDGEYLSSSFVSFQRDNLSSASFPLSESGSFSDVRCYGVNFYNSDNIPVNLSDVLWEFDLDFVLWRDDVLQMLSDIYDLLSDAESVSSYKAPDLASKMVDENIINDLSYNSGDVQQDLNDNIDRGIQALGSDGGVLQSLSSQIIGLGNGKIFSLLIISLSLGILILILGKNKND